MLYKIIDKYYYYTKGYYPFFKYCPPTLRLHYLKKRFFDATHYIPDFENPKTLNEKIWNIQLYEMPQKQVEYTDKLLFKKYIISKFGEQYAAKLINEADSFKNLNFNYNDLPDKFAIKCNHSWKMNIFILNKKVLFINNKKKLYKAKKIMNEFMRRNYYYY